MTESRSKKTAQRKKRAYESPRVLYREQVTVQCNVCTGPTFKGSEPCTLFSS